MAVQIKLRRKYRRGFRSTYKGGERAAPPKKRNKLSDVKKMKLPPQRPRVLVVDGKTGKGVMADG